MLRQRAGVSWAGMFCALWCWQFALPAGVHGQVEPIPGPLPGPQPAQLPVPSWYYDQLQEAAPAFTTLEAKFRIHTVLTVMGQESEFIENGYLHIDGDRICIIREVIDGVPEMQLLYEKGECIRYFPFVFYGHRIVPSSYDKVQLDFGRVFRPLFAHLLPKHELAGRPNMYMNGRATLDGVTYDTIAHKPDRKADTGWRPMGPQLEYWGPPPDVIYYITRDTKRINATVGRHYRQPLSNPQEIYHNMTATNRLRDFASFGQLTLPTVVTHEIVYKGQTSAARVSTMTLSDVKVNGGVDGDVFKPTWPDGTLFLDVETQHGSKYEEYGHKIEYMIMLADYYFGTEHPDEGMVWLRKVEDYIGDRRPTPCELGHLARLWARAGDWRKGEALHTEVIHEVEDLRDHAESPEARDELELLLSQYETEFAFAVSKNTGFRMNKMAARYLACKLEAYRYPEALVRLAWVAASRYAAAEVYKLAAEVLDSVKEKVMDDPEAYKLLQACYVQLENVQQREVHEMRKKAKFKRIRELRESIEKHRDGGAGSRVNVEALRKELERLRSEP